MGSKFAKMKKQAKQMQEQMLKMQEDMEALEAVGEAGGGLVKITINGEKKMKNVQIQPDCVDPSDVEGLQDLIIAAFADASKQVEEKSSGPGNVSGFF